MACGILSGDGEGSVEADDVGFTGYLVEGAEAVGAFTSGTGRVAEHHFHACGACPLLHDASYIAYTYYAYCGVGQAVAEMYGGGHNILGYSRSVTSGRARRGDTVIVAPVEVYVVGADGGRADKLYRRCAKECLVGACACAYDYCVGLSDGFRGEVAGGETRYIGNAVEAIVDKWDAALDDDARLAVKVHRHRPIKISVRKAMSVVPGPVAPRLRRLNSRVTK